MRKKALLGTSIAIAVSLVVIPVVVTAAQVVAVADVAKHGHIDELPHVPLEESWDVRVFWICVGGVVLFIIGRVMGRCWEEAAKVVHPSPDYNLGDRWKSLDNQVILDIPSGELATMRLMNHGDDLVLTVTETGSGSHCGGSDFTTTETEIGNYDGDADLAVTDTEIGFLAEGTLHCYKSVYKVGQFKLKKQPGRLNDLLLKLKFDDGRAEEIKLARS